MSDEQKITTLRVAGYEPPRVTTETLDSGGNYVDPTWSDASPMGGNAAALGIGTRGLSDIE